MVEVLPRVEVRWVKMEVLGIRQTEEGGKEERW